jgi:hypothetical protein
MRSLNGNIERGHGLISSKFFGNSGATSASRVVASITEVTDPGGEPFVGAASLSVLNVSLNNAGEIWMKVFVNWQTDLNYRITVFIDQ